ncbi:MAG: iron ABC transporter permease [Actinobacteria bacterium]|nr:MAG: iron ABC transporter permease [Actinomycetota bacterium]
MTSHPPRIAERPAPASHPPGQTAPPGPDSRPRRNRGRAVGLVVACCLLLAVVVLSLAVGARSLPLTEVWHGLVDEDSPAYAIVRQMRLPRTLLGLLVGAALGVAGALMQSVTRNPVADPGLLGINSGAAAAVVTAIALFGVTSTRSYIWFAFVGAVLVTALVWTVSGGRAATPVRIVLAGAALNAAMYAYVTAVEVLDTATLDRVRFWTVGSLAAARPQTVTAIVAFVVAGLVLALALARPLNALALGDDSARSLGAHPIRIRIASIVAITLLCGAATAACGPISFIGLLVPHLARVWTGPDLRWSLPYCALLGPITLLGADIVGRVAARPAEIQVGVATAVLGGAFFIWAVRRLRWATT